MLYEGEVVTIDHAISTSPIKLQPMQLQLKPLLESILDFPAFASYLKQHQLDGVRCLALRPCYTWPKAAICTLL